MSYLIARVDTWEIHLTLDGQDFGVWEKKSGGQGDSEETKVRLGAMGPQVAIGGSQTIDNVTLSRLYDLNSIHTQIQQLLARRGRGACVVKQIPYDHDGNPYGNPIVYTGVLKAVTPPTVDAEGTDAAMIEVEIAVDSVVA